MYYQLGEVKDIDKIQDDWFMDNVENHFEGRYPEEPRSTSNGAVYGLYRQGWREMEVEMFVTHKKFPEQITSVVNTLTAIKQLVDDTGITINMKRVSSGVSWKEV